MALEGYFKQFINYIWLEILFNSKLEASLYNK